MSAVSQLLSQTSLDAQVATTAAVAAQLLVAKSNYVTRHSKTDENMGAGLGNRKYVAFPFFAHMGKFT